MPARINLPMDRIRAFCEKWGVRELSLFGSVLRDDFRPDSDVDVLVTFAVDRRKTLFDVVQMREELQAIFGREVDLVEEDCLENPYRRQAILRSKELVYAA